MAAAAKNIIAIAHTISLVSDYAVQKLASEQYCLVFHGLYGMETFGLSYFNIFGPRQDPDSPHEAVVPKFATALCGWETPVVHGDGEQSRDFTFVENVVEANLAALSAPASAAGRAYNIASGESFSVNQLFAVLREILDGLGLGPAAEPVRGEARPGGVRHPVADIRRATERLGYRVRVGFREGLERTVAWYREQHNT